MLHPYQLCDDHDMAWSAVLCCAVCLGWGPLFPIKSMRRFRMTPAEATHMFLTGKPSHLAAAFTDVLTSTLSWSAVVFVVRLDHTATVIPSAHVVCKPARAVLAGRVPKAAKQAGLQPTQDHGYLLHATSDKHVHTYWLPESSEGLSCCARHCLAVCVLASFAGRPPKRFRKSEDDNVNDLRSFINRGVSNIKSLRTRVSSKARRSLDGGIVGSDDMQLSPKASVSAEEKLPV